MNKYFLFLYFFIIFSISFFLGWINIFFLPLSFLVVYLLYFNQDIAKEKIKIKKYFIIIPIIIFLVSRFVPFLSSPHPLGYDTGFYNYNIEKERIIIQENNKSKRGVVQKKSKNIIGLNLVDKFNLVEVESVGSRYITKSLIKIGLNNWIILYAFYILMGFITGVLIYFVVKEFFNKEAAFFSFLIYSLSTVQYVSYWNMLWKHAIGLNLILLVLLLLEKNKNIYKYFFIPILIIILIFTHKTSAILLLIILSIYLILNYKSNKFFIFVFIIIVLIATYIYNDLFIYLWRQYISGFSYYYDFFSVKEGVFMDIKDYLYKAVVYLPFGILGFLNYAKLKKQKSIVLLFIITAFLVSIKFIFYKRLIIYFDIALIIFSGYMFYQFLSVVKNKLNKYIFNIIMIVFLAIGIILLYNEVQIKKPLLEKNAINNIVDIKSIYPQTEIFVFDSYFTPWLYGFSGHKIFAPGWGDEDWDLEKWIDFWNSDDSRKIDILEERNKEYIIFTSRGFMEIEDDRLLNINNNFLYFGNNL